VCGVDSTRHPIVTAPPRSIESGVLLSRRAKQAVAKETAGWFQSPLLLPVYLPFLLLALLTVLFRISEADLNICRMSYDRGGQGWWGTGSALLQFIYKVGPAPALALGIGGLAVGILSLFWRPLRPCREAGFFFAAMLALGPGLIVNGVLKPHWNRPRPVQTLAFGGSQPFVPVWQSGPYPRSKSFPSGHASMGFYLFAPAFLLYRKRRAWALAFVAVGLIGGLVIGAGRVLQGAHYPSDVLWSAGMVYLSGLILYGVLLLFKSAADRRGVVADPASKTVLVMLRLAQRQCGQAAEAAPIRRAA
jgi:membrane-associated PAP2 superfamily phosphatase